MKAPQIIFFLFQITHIIFYPSEKNTTLKPSKWNNKNYKSDTIDKVKVNEENKEIHEALDYNRKNFIFLRKHTKEAKIHTNDFLILYNETPEGFTSLQQTIIDNFTKKINPIKNQRIKWATIQNNLFFKKKQKTISDEEFITEQKKITDNFECFIKSISSELKHENIQIAMKNATIIAKQADLIYSSIEKTKLITETKINACLAENVSKEITKISLNQKNENLLQPKLLNNQNKTTQYYNNSNISAEKNCHCTIM
ncbi:MAG: hypothetical protein ACXWL5_03035 [Candidatus Chromulinivorax sp.]